MVISEGNGPKHANANLRFLCACFGARPENSKVVFVRANAAGTLEHRKLYNLP